MYTYMKAGSYGVSLNRHSYKSMQRSKFVLHQQFMHTTTYWTYIATDEMTAML